MQLASTYTMELPAAKEEEVATAIGRAMSFSYQTETPANLVECPAATARVATMTTTATTSVRRAPGLQQLPAANRIERKAEGGIRPRLPRRGAGR